MDDRVQIDTKYAASSVRLMVIKDELAQCVRAGHLSAYRSANMTGLIGDPLVQRSHPTRCHIITACSIIALH